MSCGNLNSSQYLIYNMCVCVCVPLLQAHSVTFSMLCPALNFVFLDKFIEQNLFYQDLVDFNTVF